MSETLRELYASANGDTWYLQDSPEAVFVIHQPNEASGGQRSRIPASEFVRRGGSGPEVMAARRALAERGASPLDEGAMEHVMRDCPL